MMNTISWLIYAADILPNLKGIGVFGLFIAAVLAFCLPPRGIEMFSNEHHAPFMGIRRAAPWLICGISLMLITFTPSSKTIYLIAASEIGETVVTHPETLEMFNDVKSVIQKRLREELAD